MTGRHAHTLRAALAASDVAAAITAAILAYAVRIASGLFPVQGRTDILPERYLAALPAAVLLLVLATAAAGLYDSRRAARTPDMADMLRVGGFAAAALATVTLLYWSEFQYSRAVVFGAAALYAPACAAFRRVALRLLARSGSAARTPGALVIGGGAPAAALDRALREHTWPPIRVEAVLPIGDDAAFPGARRLPDLERACIEAARGDYSEVFVALPASEAARAPALLSRLEHTTADVRLVPDLGDAVLVNPGATVLGGVPVLSLRERPLYGIRAATKRAVDVVLAAVLLVTLAPFLVLIGILVRLTSEGPALFVQERMGLDGRPFDILKFRTMRIGAEDATGPVFAKPGDPRATPLGRVLRRLSLDELPQLWNVLRGDMSLVGPRPERAPFIDEFRRRLPGYMLRHTVKAGMTGLAQVHGFRGDSSFETRLRYDLEYVDRWSLTLDLEILGRTAIQVIVGRNAY